MANSGFSIAKLLLWGLVAIAAVVVYLRFFGGSNPIAQIPQESIVNYVPSEFNANIDEDRALAILSNPYRYEEEFNDLIYSVNRNMLEHVMNRIDIRDTMRLAVLKKYDEQHPVILQLYFNDFVTMRDTNDLDNQRWFGTELTSAVDILEEVSQKYTCFMVSLTLGTVLPVDSGKIYVKGADAKTPCAVAMGEALHPMIARLDERAAINDFSYAKGYIQERITSTIAELATVEIRDKKGLSRQLQTKIWGFNVSTTDVEMSAISVLKIGFDLNKHLDINLDAKSRKLIVSLPDPEILSHEVYPRIDNLDIGWMRELKDEDFNKNFDLLRKVFREEAQASDAFSQAKTKAASLMTTILEPIAFSVHPKTKIEIQFNNKIPMGTPTLSAI